MHRCDLNAVGMQIHPAGGVLHFEFVKCLVLARFPKNQIPAAVQNAKSSVATKINGLLYTSIGLLMSTDIQWGCEWLNRSIENPTELP